MTERRVCPEEAHVGSVAKLTDLADMGRSPSRGSGQAFLRPYEEKADDAAGNGGAKQRRSGRVSERVAVVMLWSDGEGRVFSEETHTVVLSQHGAGIVSQHRMMPEQDLILRAVELQKEAEVRVVGEIAKQGEVYTYGVALVDEALDFWQREFPPAPLWDKQPEILTLECVGREGVEEVKNGDFEYDIDFLCFLHLFYFLNLFLPHPRRRHFVRLPPHRQMRSLVAVPHQPSMNRARS